MVDRCLCPGCGATTDDVTLYEEPLRHEDGTMLVCGRHADFDKDGIRAYDGPAAPLNDEILRTLKAD